MDKLEDSKILEEIAHMYYDDGLTQQQIAKRMNMSRSLISKLLTKARKKGIVEIIIHSETRPYKELEDKLKKVLGLKEVKIVGCEQNNLVSVEAGKYLSMKLSRCQYVVISAGHTIYDVAMNFSSSTTFSNVVFIPASGGLGEVRWEIDANNICAIFAQKSGARNMQIHAPITVDSDEAKHILMEQHFIKSILENARNADLALVGIGNSLQWLELEETYLQDVKDEYYLDEKIMRGDICYNYFDKNGELIDCKWNRHLMGISLSEIKKIPEIICVAGDVAKAESIYIAAQKKIITTLITNVNVAKRVLWYYSKDLYRDMEKFR